MKRETARALDDERATPRWKIQIWRKDTRCSIAPKDGAFDQSNFYKNNNDTQHLE